MIKKLALAIKGISIVIVVVVFLSFAMSIVALLLGVKFDSIQIANIQINKAEFKLRKGLSIDMQDLKVLPPKVSALKQDAKTKPSLDLSINPSYLPYIKYAFFWLYFIDKINIANFTSPEFNASIALNNNILSLNSQKVSAKILLGFNEPNVNLNIQNIRLKNIDTNLSGSLNINPLSKSYDGRITVNSPVGKCLSNVDGNFKRANFYAYSCNLAYENYDFKSLNTRLEYDFESSDLSFSSRANSMDIEGDVKGSIKNGVLTAHFTNAYAKSIEKIIEAVPLTRLTKDWIYVHPTSKDYFLKRLSLKIDLKTAEFDSKYFFIDGLITNVSTKFQDGLEPVFSPLFELKIQDEKVHINAQNSIYNNKKLDLELFISSISKNDSVLSIKAKTTESLDKTFFDIARSFGTDLGIEQLSGKSNSTIKIDLGLGDDSFNIDIDTNIKNSRLNVEGFEVFVTELNATKRGKDIQAKALLRNFYDDYFLLNLNGKYKNKQIKTQISLDNFYIFSKEFFYLKDKNISLDFNWQKNLQIKSSDLGLDFGLKNSSFNLDVKDLGRFIANSKILQKLGFINARLNAKGTKTNTKLDAKAFFTRSPIYKNGKNLNNISISLEKTPKKISINLSKLINIVIADEASIYLNDMDIDLSNLVNAFNSKKSSKASKPLSIKAQKTNLKYKDLWLKSDWFYATRKNDNLVLNLSKQNGKLYINKNSNTIEIRAKDMPSSFITDLSSAQIDQNQGSLNILAKGDTKDKTISGLVQLKDIVIKEAKGIMNIIALLNATPALAQFKRPGFNANGYEIKNGLIDFFYTNNEIFIKTMRLTGTHTDIIAQGSINLKEGTIDMILSINTIKDLSNIISSIPLVGYIFLDNKTIGTVVGVSGKLEKPSLDINPAKEVLQYPAEILRRVLLLPFNIFK